MHRKLIGLCVVVPGYHPAQLLEDSPQWAQAQVEVEQNPINPSNPLDNVLITVSASGAVYVAITEVVE